MNADRGGFALLAALWLVVAISVVGLQWGLQTRDGRRVVMNTLDAVNAQAAAESGVAQAQARLTEAVARAQDVRFDGDARQRLDAWWEPTLVVFDTIGDTGTGRWRLHVEDAGTRLHLNRATEDELRRFLIALRIDAGRADLIAQSIADWRDRDDAHRPRGAEWQWYRKEGRVVLPRNGPFRQLPELRHVRGIDEDIYQRIVPYLSLDGSGRVNLMTAPRAVLLALPGFGEEVVRALEWRRRERRPIPALSTLLDGLSPFAASELAANLNLLSTRVTLETEEVRITSKGYVGRSPVVVVARAIAVRNGNTVIVTSLQVTP